MNRKYTHIREHDSYETPQEKTEYQKRQRGSVPVIDKPRYRQSRPFWASRRKTTTTTTTQRPEVDEGYTFHQASEVSDLADDEFFFDQIGDKRSTEAPIDAEVYPGKKVDRGVLLVQGRRKGSGGKVKKEKKDSEEDENHGYDYYDEDEEVAEQVKSRTPKQHRERGQDADEEDDEVTKTVTTKVIQRKNKPKASTYPQTFHSPDEVHREIERISHDRMKNKGKIGGYWVVQYVPPEE